MPVVHQNYSKVLVKIRVADKDNILDGKNTNHTFSLFFKPSFMVVKLYAEHNKIKCRP